MASQAFLVTLLLGVLLAVQPALSRPSSIQHDMVKEEVHKERKEVEHVEKFVEKSPVEKVVEHEQVIQKEVPVKEEVEREQVIQKEVPVEKVVSKAQVNVPVVQEQVEKIVERPKDELKAIENEEQFLEGELKSSQEEEAEARAQDGKMSASVLKLRAEEDAFKRTEAELAKQEKVVPENLEYQEVPEVVEVEVPEVEEVPIINQEYLRERRVDLLKRISLIKRAIATMAEADDMYRLLKSEFLRMESITTQDAVKEEKLRQVSAKEIALLTEEEKEYLRKSVLELKKEHVTSKEIEQLRRELADEKEIEIKVRAEAEAKFAHERAIADKLVQEQSKIHDELVSEIDDVKEETQENNVEKGDIKVDSEHLRHILAELRRDAELLLQDKSNLVDAAKEEALLKRKDVDVEHQKHVEELRNERLLKALREHIERIVKNEEEAEKKAASLKVDLELKLTIAYKSVAELRHQVKVEKTREDHLLAQLAEARKNEKIDIVRSHHYHVEIERLTKELGAARSTSARLTVQLHISEHRLNVLKAQLATAVADAKRREADLEHELKAETAEVVHLEGVIRANKLAYENELREEKAKYLALAKKLLHAFALRVEERERKAALKRHEEQVKSEELRSVEDEEAIKKREEEELAAKKRHEEELKQEEARKLEREERLKNLEKKLAEAVDADKKAEIELKIKEEKLMQDKEIEARIDAKLRADSKDIADERHKDEQEKAQLEHEKKLLEDQQAKFEHKSEELDFQLKAEKTTAADDIRRLKALLDADEKNVKDNDVKIAKLLKELSDERRIEVIERLAAERDSKTIARNEKITKEKFARLVAIAKAAKLAYERADEARVAALKKIIQRLEAELKVDHKDDTEEVKKYIYEKELELKEAKLREQLKVHMGHEIADLHAEVRHLRQIYNKLKIIFITLQKTRNALAKEVKQLKNRNEVLTETLEKYHVENVEDTKEIQADKHRIAVLEHDLRVAEEALKEAKIRLINAEKEDKLRAEREENLLRKHIDSLVHVMSIKAKEWAIEELKLKHEIATLRPLKSKLAEVLKEERLDTEREERLVEILRNTKSQKSEDLAKYLKEEHELIIQRRLYHQKAQKDVAAVEDEFNLKIKELLVKERDEKKTLDLEILKYRNEFDTLLDVNRVLMEIADRVRKEMIDERAQWLGDEIKRLDIQDAKIRAYIQHAKEQIKAIRVGSATRSIGTKSNFTVHIHLLSLHTKGTMFFIDWVNMILKTWKKDVAAINNAIHRKFDDKVYITHHGEITNDGTDFHYEWVATGENMDTNKFVHDRVHEIRLTWRALVKKVWFEYMKAWTYDLSQRNKVLTEQTKVDQAEVTSSSHVTETSDLVHLEFVAKSSNTDGTNVFSYLVKALSQNWHQIIVDSEEILQAYNHGQLSFQYSAQTQDDGKTYVVVFNIRGKNVDVNKSVKLAVLRLKQQWADTVRVDWDASVDLWRLSFESRVEAQLREILVKEAKEKVMYETYVKFDEAEESRIKRRAQAAVMERKIREEIENAAEFKKVSKVVGEATSDFSKRVRSDFDAQVERAKEAEVANRVAVDKLNKEREIVSEVGIRWSAAEERDDSGATLKLTITSKNTKGTHIFTDFLSLFRGEWDTKSAGIAETIRDIFRNKVTVSVHSHIIHDNTGIEYVYKISGRDLESNTLLTAWLKKIETAFSQTVTASWRTLESEDNARFEAQDKELTEEERIAVAVLSTNVKLERTNDHIEAVFDLSSSNTDGTDIFSNFATSFFASFGAKVGKIDQLISAQNHGKVSAKYSGALDDDNTGYRFVWSVSGKNIEDNMNVAAWVEKILEMFGADVEIRWGSYKAKIRETEIKDYDLTMQKLRSEWLAEMKAEELKSAAEEVEIREKEMAEMKAMTTPAPIVHDKTSFFL